uniref:Hexosyltransferase n=2 Tax=Cyprinus carpio carpio TaxID=630221 RepID=A0A9J7YZX0_CYPCA
MGLQKFNEEIHKTQQFRSEDRGKCSTCEEQLLWTAVIKVHPLLFRYSYRRRNPGHFTPDSLMDLTLDLPCRCPRCGEGIFKMKSNWKTTKMLGLMMLANFLIYVVVEVSRSYGQGRDIYNRRKLTPKKFWKKPEFSQAFWNREQERLDDIYYLPLANGSDAPRDFRGIPLWLKHVSPCRPDSRVLTEIEDFKSLPKRFQDFLLYMGCRSYPLITDAPNMCSEPPYLLLAVKSIAPHFDRRQAIRESWGRAGILNGHRIVTVFLLGNTAATDHFPDLSDMVKHEAALYGDVLQWDYRDTFFNLTLKEVLFLEWFGTHCASAKYVFKCDDDVFVNTRHMLAYLGNFSVSKTQDIFIGDVITNAGPHRTRHLKYYIPESVFRGVYPPYAGGGGYLYSGNLGLRLRMISRLVTLYPIDDVFTGMCLKRLGLVPEKHMGFKTFDIEEKHRENPCAYKSLILVHPRSPQDMIKIWSWINDPKVKCCIKTTLNTKCAM